MPGANGNGGPEAQGKFTLPPQITKFPPKGWDFPRRYLEVTPSEILYDPGRILGTRVSAVLSKRGDVILRQPRLESTGYLQREAINDCPPPSQIPVVKQQIHTEPSRDAETLYCTHAVDVPALSSVVALAFDTFPNLRHFIRWIDVQVFDALWPVQLTEQVRIDCDPKKFVACPQSTTTMLMSGLTCDFGAGTVSTPSALDMTTPPPYFYNVLYEITDRHHVDIIINNLAPADRRVQVTVWGWIESITVWDEVVKR